jgi:hypothetical protein
VVLAGQTSWTAKRGKLGDRFARGAARGPAPNQLQVVDSLTMQQVALDDLLVHRVDRGEHLVEVGT